MPANVDTSEAIARFEHELENGAPADRRALLLSILTRWQVDLDLAPTSRQRAGQVLRWFRSRD